MHMIGIALCFVCAGFNTIVLRELWKDGDGLVGRPDLPVAVERYFCNMRDVSSENRVVGNPIRQEPLSQSPFHH